MNDPRRSPAGWVTGLIDALRRWPLLLTGLAVLSWAVILAPPGDPDTVVALTIVGAVLLGAGLVRVVIEHRHDVADRADDPDDPPPRHNR